MTESGRSLRFRVTARRNITKTSHPTWKTAARPHRWLSTINTQQPSCVSLTAVKREWMTWLQIYRGDPRDELTAIKLHSLQTHLPALQTLSLLIVQPLCASTDWSTACLWSILTVLGVHVLCVWSFIPLFLSETRSCRLGSQLCWGLTGRPEHPLHPPALSVHADVWGSHCRKHSS